MLFEGTGVLKEIVLDNLSSISVTIAKYHAETVALWLVEITQIIISNNYQQ